MVSSKLISVTNSLFHNIPEKDIAKWQNHENNQFAYLTTLLFQPKCWNIYPLQIQIDVYVLRTKKLRLRGELYSRSNLAECSAVPIRNAQTIVISRMPQSSKSASCRIFFQVMTHSNAKEFCTCEHMCYGSYPRLHVAKTYWIWWT